jgi:hypothetical protein
VADVNEPGDQTWTETGDEARVEAMSDQEIRTEAEAMAFAKVDESIWRVKHMEIGAHHVTLKLRTQVGVDDRGRPVFKDTPVRKRNWRIWLRLERIQPKPLHDALELFYQRLAAVAPNYAPVPVKPSRPKNELYLMELGLYDCHFGKLCWSKETGDDYDLKIATKVFANAAADLLDRARGYQDQIERFLLVVGNDFFHSDTLEGSTTKGTKLDCDGRYHKVFEAGLAAGCGLVEQLLMVAPVDLIHISGNHDYLSSWHFAKTIEATFSRSSDVRVDVSPNPRKYYAWGTTLIGLDHGDSCKPKDLPGLMLHDVPRKMLAKAKFLEWHRGHRHISEATRVKALHHCQETETVQGMMIRTIPSLSGTDLWHHKSGYVNSIHSAEAYLYEHTHGPTAQFSVHAR